jgi:nucleoside-diphosphate-sugar epimerase
MGPSLAVLARRSLDEAALPHRVICVSRFSNVSARTRLDDAGVETVACDLLDPDSVEALPDAPNVTFMAGMKFGASSAPWLAWAQNAHLPGLAGARYRHARIVALSTGNVYPFVAPASGGATEDTPPSPVGEYAQTCLGRERMFEFVSDRYGTRVATIRLNYATDLRYGVLLDIAQQVAAGRPVSVETGYANTIWQGDANAVLLQAFALCASPPLVLNLTGPETFSVREVAQRFAELFGLPPPAFDGVERETALLANSSRCRSLSGEPRVGLDQLVEWTAQWVRNGAPTLGKPTHFELRDGAF